MTNRCWNFKNPSIESWDMTEDNIYGSNCTSLKPLSQCCLPIRHFSISGKTKGTFVHNLVFLEQKWLSILKKWKKLNLIGILLSQWSWLILVPNQEWYFSKHCDFYGPYCNAASLLTKIWHLTDRAWPMNKYCPDQWSFTISEISMHCSKLKF